MGSLGLLAASVHELRVVMMILISGLFPGAPRLSDCHGRALPTSRFEMFYSCLKANQGCLMLKGRTHNGFIYTVIKQVAVSQLLTELGKSHHHVRSTTTVGGIFRVSE